MACASLLGIPHLVLLLLTSSSGRGFPLSFLSLTNLLMIYNLREGAEVRFHPRRFRARMGSLKPKFVSIVLLTILTDNVPLRVNGQTRTVCLLDLKGSHFPSTQTMSQIRIYLGRNGSHDYKQNSSLSYGVLHTTPIYPYEVAVRTYKKEHSCVYMHLLPHTIPVPTSSLLSMAQRMNHEQFPPPALIPDARKKSIFGFTIDCSP